MDHSLIRTSKFLSLVLRHRPEVIGVALDPDCWLDINALIANANSHGHAITLQQLHDVVANNDKQRFALSEDGMCIRANQGHSVRHVDLDLPVVQPPIHLYHGTVTQFLASIRAQGLLKRSRNHVHLSADREAAKKVGMRRGDPVVLTIAAGEMHAAGRRFYRSVNGVWLTDAVPPEYISFP